MASDATGHPGGQAGRAASERLPSGWAALDEALGGGLAPGLAEVCGRGCASLAQGVVRQAQARGLPVAWIDGRAGFCPATADLDMQALTLVQPLAPLLEGAPPSSAESSAESSAKSSAKSSAASSAASSEPSALSSGGSRSLSCVPTRERVRRVLLAADVLARSRAFGLIVLDGPAGRGSAGAWFRLARLAERSHSVFLVLHDGARSLAGSAAGLLLAVRLCPSEAPEWEAPARPDLEVVVRRHRARPGVRRLVLSAAPS